MVFPPDKDHADEVRVLAQSLLGSPPAVDQVVSHKPSIGRDGSA